MIVGVAQADDGRQKIRSWQVVAWLRRVSEDLNLQFFWQVGETVKCGGGLLVG